MNIVNKFYNINICVPFMPLGDTSCNFAPTSFIKPTATSTESSVGFSNRRVSNSNAKISWAYNIIKTIIYLKAIITKLKLELARIGRCIRI